MAEADKQQVVEALLDHYGNRSLAEEADITVGDKPNTLFQLLQLGMLASVRVTPATAAFRVLRDRGWTTAKHLHDSGHEERVDVLRDHGYPDPDADRVSRMMGHAAAHLLDQYGGRTDDLRDATGRDPEGIRKSSRTLSRPTPPPPTPSSARSSSSGGSCCPSPTKKALDAAERLDLASDPAELRRLVADDTEFVRLVGALVRLRHDDAYDEVCERALAG